MNKEQVRVRFAPSPTGFLHVGSLRTALYNYLFARQHNGVFVLRIEDTDQKRYVEGAVENLLETLRWSGLEYDEGPEKEGPYGPYFQSQRLDLYKKYVNQLIEHDHAYPCFCSEDRLNAMREEQAAKGQAVMYDGLCRSIPRKEAQERMGREDHVIRLKVPDSGFSEVDDIIRGKVRFENALLDDQVLLKSDGFPTYHLANVVDDHLMKISHVIRGEEWLPSTPKHILLYQAFGWEPPHFAHLPLLLNEDRSKLSKRQGDVAVEDYRAKGILPEALLNFVALLGWNRGDDQEIFTLDELVNDFSLERVNKAGAVFNLEKLDWLNGYYIRHLDESDYLRIGKEWLDKLELTTGNDENDKTILLAVRNHLNRFDQLKEESRIFFTDDFEYTDEARQWIDKKESQMLLTLMLEKVGQYDPLNLDTFRSLMKEVQKESGLKGKDLWMPVRAALTGTVAGPELPAVIQVFGKEKVQRLLKNILRES
ncbi:MAG TPA: glutamate--tRNA ligase [Caldithrix abyssi]|uniref:Glutamate--tRNA ligase n=1 Tax=Caldithrix abyssi TaxID=187145 RepID=A0A7V4TZ54_CALAY|nr:glutamate--tRNA ligase [Caldithrix abyssi]